MQQDGLTWQDFYLSKCNGDPIEGLHGEGRQYFGNDVNFTGAGWCRILSRLQVQAEMKAWLQSYGMEFAVPRHNAKTGAHQLNLGCPQAGRESLIHLEDFQLLDASYSEFVTMVLEERSRAIDDGLRDFAEYLLTAAKQLEDADLWGVFPEYDYLDWDGDIKVHLPTCLADVRTPPAAVGPNDLHVPEANLKAMREFEKKVAEEEARDATDEMAGAGSDSEEETEQDNEGIRMDRLRQKAVDDFKALENVSADVKAFTAEGRCVSAETWNSLS